MANAVGHSSLGSLGTIYYNGVDLTGPEVEVVITQNVVGDSADRTEEYVRISIEIKKAVNAADIQSVVNKLSAYGGELKLTNYGFHSLWVNGTGSPVKDIAFGPKPKVLSWTPLRPGLGWMLHWTVETCIPYCSDGSVAYKNKLQSLCYTVGYAIDEMGLTVRTISGHMTIPLTRPSQGMRALIDNVDNYWETIAPTVPLAFRRVTNDRTISEDKRTINFTIIDKEEEGDDPIPSGIVKMDVEESVTSQGMPFIFWEYTLTGSIKVARPYPKSWAWDKFAIVMASRRDWHNSHGQPFGNDQPGIEKPSDPNGNPVAKKGQIQYITGFRFSDAIYGRQTDFEVSWRLVCALKDILQMSGVFTPVNANTWDDWRTSMVNYPWSKRGGAGFIFENSNDAILDLCVNPTFNPEQYTTRGQQTESTPTTSEPIEPDDEDLTWIAYECKLTYVQENNEVEHRTLPTSTSYAVTTGTPANNLAVISKPAPTINIAVTLGGGTVDDGMVVQNRGSSVYRVFVSGYAERIRHQITEPMLVSVGGKPCTKVGGTFEQTNIGNNGIPRYIAKWNAEYIVEGQPPALPVMPVPAAH